MLDFSFMFIIYGIFPSTFVLYIVPHFSLNLYFSLVDCDKEAECFGNLTDGEIYDSVKLNRQEKIDLEEEDEEEAEIVDKPMPGVSHKDALMGLSLVRRYLEEHFTDYNSFYDIEDMIEKNVSINRTQRKITDFFK